MRALERRAEAEGAPLEAHHLLSGYHSAELRLERWPQPFPIAVRRRLVRHLVDVHDRWHARLPGLEGDVYLGIWLFEPGFEESQVVAAVGKRAAEYRARHDPANRAAPPALYHGHPYDLARFQWTRTVWHSRDRLSSFHRSDWPALLRRASAVQRTDDDVEVTFRHEDWLATLPGR